MGMFDKYLNDFGFIGSEKLSTHTLDNIEYQYNSLGHREREPEDIVKEDYILFVGCSITEGVSVHADNRFPSIFEKESGIKTYNMGMGGTGYDVVNNNISTWFRVYRNTPPKSVIIMYSDYNRVVTRLDQNRNRLDSVGHWRKFEPIRNFFLAADSINFMKTNADVHHNSVIGLLEYSNTHHIFLTSSKPNSDRHIQIVDQSEYRKGIDNIHPGKEWHEAVALQLLTIYNL